MSNEMSKAAAIEHLRRIALTTALPAGDMDGIESLLKAGELQVAFENLVTQIDEYEFELASDDRDVLVAVGEHFNVAAPYIQMVRGE